MNVDKVNKCLRCLGIGYQFREDKKIKTKQNKEVHRKRTISDWNIPIVIINLILLASLCAYYFWGSQLDFLGYVFPLLGMYSFLTQRVVNNSKNLALSYVLYSLSTFSFLDKQFLSTVILFIIYLIADKLPINILEGLSILVTKSWEFFQDIKPWLVANMLTDITLFSLMSLFDGLENVNIKGYLATFLALLIIFAPPAIRVWLGVKNYTAYHGIDKDSDKTFFIAYLLQYLFTWSYYSFIIYRFFIEDNSIWNEFFMLIVFYLFTIFIISIVKSIIDNGGGDKKELVILVLLMIAVIFIVALLDFFGSDGINLLVWFLPIVFYNVIGGLKEVSDRPVKQAFNRLLYKLTFYTFLGLGIFNIVHISLSETRVVFRDTETYKEFRQVQDIKDNHKVEVVVTEEDILKKLIKSKVTEETRNSPVSMKTLDFMISLFQLVVSFAIAGCLGLKFEKILYEKILNNNRYFKEVKPPRRYRLHTK